MLAPCARALCAWAGRVSTGLVLAAMCYNPVSQPQGVSMKSLVAVVSFAAVLLVAAACGDGKSDSVPEPRGTTPLADGATPVPDTSAMGKIAFASDRDGDFEIYVMNADGSDQINLTSSPGDDGSRGFAWSPDGARIAFTSFRDGNDEVYVMNADGSDQINLTNNPDTDNHPFWSPDGARIAFTSFRDGDREVYVMNADGSDQINLSANPAEDGITDLAWSPDSTRVAFDSQRDRTRQVYVIDADGSDLTRLTNDNAGGSFPSWSPDGSRLAFVRGFDIYTMKADGSDIARLTTRGGNLAWSQDGSRIAFASDRDGNVEIYVMNADGSEPTRLTDDPAIDGVPGLGWSPNSERIAFSRTMHTVRFEVWIMNADGSDQVLVAEAQAAFPAWSPVP